MIKISVIVPIYNVEKYLKRCLDSLVNQTLEDIEIILVNDASPDNCINIMEEYKNKYPFKIKIVNSKVNLKQGGAKNLGLNIAKGEFVGFIDSDDWISHEMYEKLYKRAIETNSDIVDCDLYWASDGSNIIRSEKSNYMNQTGELTTNKKKSLILHSGRMVTKIYKREIFEENSIRFSENLCYEDNEIIPLIMVFSQKLSKVEEELYYYFVSNSTSTTRKLDSLHHFDRLITAKRMVDNFKKCKQYNVYKSEVDFRFIELFYVNTIPLCLTKFSKPQIEYLKKIRSYMSINFHDYRNNKYFKSRINLKKKILSRVNDFSPRLLVLSYLVLKKIMNYSLYEGQK